jgi:FtsZ-binding cell division protein ZapB
MTEEVEDYSEYTLEQINDKIDSLCGTIKFLQDEVDQIILKIEALRSFVKVAQERQAYLKYHRFDDYANNGKPLTKEEIDFVLIPDHGSMDSYRTAQKIIENKTALQRSGYNPETNQSSFTLCFYKGDKENFDRTVESIELLSPHIKPIDIEIKSFGSPNKKINGVRFGVFEHTLSAGGIYQYIIENYGTSNVKYYLLKTSYSRTAILKEFNDFIESLKYIEDNHYYEWANKSKNYNDDEEY